MTNEQKDSIAKAVSGLLSLQPIKETRAELNEGIVFLTTHMPEELVNGYTLNFFNILYEIDGFLHDIQDVLEPKIKTPGKADTLPGANANNC